MSDFGEIRDHLKFEHDIVKYEVDLLLHLCLINSKERNVIITSLGPRLDWFAVNGVIQNKKNLFEVGTGSNTGAVNVTLTDGSEQEETQTLDLKVMDESMYFSFSETLTQSDCGLSEEGFVENKQENIFVEKKKEGEIYDFTHQNEEKKQISNGMIFPIESKSNTNMEDAALNSTETLNISNYRTGNTSKDDCVNVNIIDTAMNKDSVITSPIKPVGPFNLVVHMLAGEVESIGGQEPEAPRNEEISWLNSTAILEGVDKASDESWLVGVESMDQQEPHLVNTVNTVNTTFEVNDKHSEQDLLQCSPFTDAVKTRSGKRHLDAEGVVENKKKAAKTEKNIYELISL